MGNANNSIVVVTNNNTGVIRGTSGLLGASLVGLTGIGLSVQNGAAGTTTITNNGIIEGMPLVGTTIPASDIPVIALWGGGKGVFTNNGTITGRVAMQGTSTGNVFTNTNTLSGSLSLGTGGGANRFNAITGSLVSAGGGVGVALPVLGLTIGFAGAGIVDGGTANNGNTLALQNAVGGGSGTGGTGTINGNNYLNFSNLIVDSGTWSLSGFLFNGASAPTVQLNGGLLNATSAALGAAPVTANGGALGASEVGVTLGNHITLGTNGLTVSGINSLTLSGVLSGAGELIKRGAGTLTLSGANSYTGGTSIQGGTLALGAGGRLSATSALNLSGTGSTFDMSIGGNQTVGALLGAAGSNIVLGANTLTFGSASSTTFAGDISGTGGSLSKNGTGTMTLTGNSSYSGMTTVASGTLEFAGTAGHQLGGGITVNDGAALGIKAATSALGAVTLANNSTLSLDASGASAPVLTADSLSIGTNVGFNLSGISSLTGDRDLISTTAVISGDFSTVSIGGFMGTVDYLTLVTQKSADNKKYVASHGLTWGAKNNLAHGTFTLAQATDEFDVGAALTDQTANGSWDGRTLTKAGAGTLVLSGGNTYTGGTQVNAGTLVAANNQALGTGNVNVGASGTLAVNSGVALKVGGNLGFQSGSIYRVFVDPDAKTSGRIDVTGNATLTGAVLDVQARKDLSTNQTYTILKAGSVIGQFASVTSNYAYLDAKVAYLHGNQVDLTLHRKPGSGGGSLGFADLSSTSNQAAAANALASLPSSHPLYQHIETLPAGAPAAVFNSLSGDTHSTVASSVSMLSAQAPNISQQHLRNNLAAGLRAGAPIAQSDGPLPASALPSSKALPAWVEVVGHWQKMDGNSNTPGVKQNTTGLFLGADEEVGGSGWRVGGSVGYTSADAKVSSRDASADISSYSAAVYTGKGFSHGANRINVMGGLAYTKHSIESERSVATLNQNLKADYSAHTAQLFAEVGYAMGQYDKQGFEPFVGITLGEQRSDSFKESGGFAALSSQSSRDTLASTTLGVRAHSDFVLAGKDTRVRGTLGVRHAWGKLSQNRTMAFEGSSSFTVAGAPLARNTALVGLQAEMALSRYSALVLGYNGEYGSGSRDQSASVKVRWAF
ncbi:autotransporter outer membrane beta-barrel domain-containing protein [Comamonas sp. CMM02]|uniref:autotransporter outer membrane beta-barrel domain-containing protein n=1 Tax=Comamonas sp. CMM02 TaxID=2769307 RepID=UPI001CE23069|nr:autotransporter outer membrane beta-barrel domain-containing protein [Comamonas sp. CMM02]